MDWQYFSFAIQKHTYFQKTKFSFKRIPAKNV